MDTKPRTESQLRSLTASATPSLLAHASAKQTKQAERQRLREDRLLARTTR